MYIVNSDSLYSTFTEFYRRLGSSENVGGKRFFLLLEEPFIYGLVQGVVS